VALGRLTRLPDMCRRANSHGAHLCSAVGRVVGRISRLIENHETRTECFGGSSVLPGAMMQLPLGEAHMIAELKNVPATQDRES
jgi:hypothetical protein